MRRRWWIMGAGLIVVIVAAIILTVVLNRPENTAAPETSSTGAAPTGKYGFPVSPIRVGEGGRELAPDGETRIGYGPSCNDAVAAAFSYLNYIATPAGKDPAAIEATGKLILTDAAYADSIAKSWAYMAREFPAGSMKAKPASPGLFKIHECTEGQRAIITTTSSILDSREKPATASVSSNVMTLLYVDGTWKLTENIAGYDTGSTGGASEKDAKDFIKVTPEVINQLFTSEGMPVSREGWMEVSNASD